MHELQDSERAGSKSAIYVALRSRNFACNVDQIINDKFCKFVIGFLSSELAASLLPQENKL